MAFYKNKPLEGYTYVNTSEKDFASFLKGLPNNWIFWHEPVVMEGKTPDFVIFIPDGEHPSIILIELKNWSKGYIKKVLPNQVILNDRFEPDNPISKLKMVKRCLTDAFFSRVEVYPEINHIPVIPLLIMYGMDQIDIPKEFLTDDDVLVCDKAMNKDIETFQNFITKISVKYYEDYCSTPPSITLEIKKAIMSLIDLRLRVLSPPFTPPPPDKPKQLPEKSKPVPQSLDEIQEGIVNLDFGHRLIGGVSGTGKTIILLARAAKIAREFPDEKVLFIVNQQVLMGNLKQRFLLHYCGEDEVLANRYAKQVNIITYKDWIINTFTDAQKKLAVKEPKESDDIISKIAESFLKIEKKSALIKNVAIKKYKHIFVDEAHQMPNIWVKLLTHFAEGYENQKPNIWIAYDNGQGFYKNRRFEGKDAGLNFQGRSIILNRVYRCGFIPWIFAAMCNPKTFLTYQKEIIKSETIEFTKIGDDPVFIEAFTLEDQAKKLAETIKGLLKPTGKYEKADICIFYAVRGLADQYAFGFGENGKTKITLDNAFRSLGDINWVTDDKKNADWSLNQIKACPFTSSQGLDSPVSVLFAVESFRRFKDNESWAEATALFYTVLTRCTDQIIITYQQLGDTNCEFQTAIKRGFDKGKVIKNIKNDFKFANSHDKVNIISVKFDTIKDMIIS